jgi:beta-glucosidase
MGLAYVTGLQSGKRRNVSETAFAKQAATCKHFAAFGSPQGGLCVLCHLTVVIYIHVLDFRNLAQVSGGERELHTSYLRPFKRACMDALTIMTAYSSYDGIPAIANKREFFLFSGWVCR